MKSPVKILALCTGNRARSIMAEALLNANPDFLASSAGSQPHGTVHPMAVTMLREHGIETDGLRSKSWGEFGVEAEDAPRFDIVLTLSDELAAQEHPIWEGTPLRAHWSIPNPSGEDEREAFQRTFDQLDARVKSLGALPLDQLDGEALRQAINEIGQTSEP